VCVLKLLQQSARVHSAAAQYWVWEVEGAWLLALLGLVGADAEACQPHQPSQQPWQVACGGSNEWLLAVRIHGLHGPLSWSFWQPAES
jgi:hypothetical protein